MKSLFFLIAFKCLHFPRLSELTEGLSCTGEQSKFVLMMLLGAKIDEFCKLTKSQTAHIFNFLN